MFPNPMPSADEMRALLNLPWTIETGVTPHGDRFARCIEVPEAVAYAGADEDLDALFWDSLKASLEARITSGQSVVLPARRTPVGLTVLVPVKAKPGQAAGVQAFEEREPNVVSGTSSPLQLA